MIPGERLLDPAKDKVPRGLCALGIMTKAPEAGRVKTRLSPPLTPEEAAELNRNFLRDLGEAIIHASSNSPGRGVAVYTPLGKASQYEGVLPPDFLFVPQRGEDFGERLRFAGEDLLAFGFETFCLINSDSPMVPAVSFAQAAQALAEPGDRVLLGPSEDGGYYLIGLKTMHRRLFEEIEWSTETVLTQTRERAAELRLETVMLPPALDVDDGATLKTLCDRLFESDQVRAAPHTRKFLAQIIEREGRDRIWPG